MRKFICLLFSFLMTASIWAQQRVIKGRVTDANGNPLSGVTVSVGGQSAGRTDQNGNFSVSAAQGNTLVFTYVGHERKEVQVGASGDIAVSLQAQAKEIEAVVVTALGQTRSKSK